MSSLEPRRTALVTGGARGIGRAITERLLADGFRVMVLDISARAIALAEELQSEHPKSLLLANASVTDRHAIEGAVDRVLSGWGRLDALVNNAGANRASTDLDMAEEDWDQIVDTNLKGSYLCSVVAAKPMAAQGAGSIVNIGSVAAAGGGNPAYAASKAGLIGLTRSLALTLGPQGVRVNLVAPGPTNTPALRHLSPRGLDEMASTVPLRRIGEPDDVAAAVAFLVSAESSYITGQVLSVSGGGWMA